MHLFLEGINGNGEGGNEEESVKKIYGDLLQRRNKN